MFAKSLLRIAALASLVVPSTARSDVTRPASLSWVRLPGAEACISGPRLAALVEGRLGKGSIVPMAGAELSIEGRMARTPDGRWKATLVLARSDGGVLGARELVSSAGSCEAVEPELALILAVMIDPDAAPSAGRSAPPAQVNRAPVPVNDTHPATTALPVFQPGFAAPSPSIQGPSPVVFPARPGPAPPPSPGGVGPPAPPWRVRLSVGPALSLGLVPSVGAGATLHVGVTPPRFWPFEAAALFTAPARTTSSDGVGGEFTLVTGRLSACPLSGVSGEWGYAACAGVELGSIRGRGTGLQVALEQEQWVANAALQGRAERRLFGPFFAGLHVGIAVPLLRARFFYVAGDGAEREVLVTAPVAGSADLSLGFELP